MKLILASASPRRQTLIQLLGLPWEVRVARVDESVVDHPDPAANVTQTAWLKASAVAEEIKRARVEEELDGSIIVAADTTVSLGQRMLNKPSGAYEARQMLRLLRNRTHQVYTGIALIVLPSGNTFTDVAHVDVPMRSFSDEEIEAYVASGDPLDKAGAYAIQHTGFRPVVDLAGCYAAVVGFPLCHLTRTLYQAGLFVSANVAQACQDFHSYVCPVYDRILSRMR